MSVEFDSEHSSPDAGRSTTHLPWIVKKGYVKNVTEANRLLIAVAVLFFCLSAVVLYLTMRESEATESQIMREVIVPTTTP